MTPQYSAIDSMLKYARLLEKLYRNKERTSGGMAYLRKAVKKGVITERTLERFAPVVKNYNISYDIIIKQCNR